MPVHATEPFVYNRAGPWKHAVVIADFSAVITATPGAVLFDEEINLGAFGCIAHTQRHLLPTVSIQKSDGAGGWIATTLLSEAPSWITGNDPAGYEVEFAYTTRMAQPHGIAESVPVMVGPVEVGGDTGGDIDASIEDGFSRIRLVARRSSRVYSEGEQTTIDAYGYRARVTLLALDLVLWEHEVAIPSAASNSLLIDERIDLAEFGLAAGIDRVVMVAELRRNGKTIRPYLEREYKAGEAFDHPAPPVRLDMRNISPFYPQWNNQNGGGSWGSAEYYGRNGWQPGPSYSAGCILAKEFGDCGEALMQNIAVTAWREDALATVYQDGSRTGVVELDLSTVTAGLTGTVYCTQLGLEAPISFVGDGGGAQERIELVTGGGCIVHFTPGQTTMASIIDALKRREDIQLAEGTSSGTDATKIRIDRGVVAADYLYTLVAGDAFSAVNLNGGAFADVAVVPARFEDCTIRLRLLGAPYHRVGEYPFTSDYSQDLRPQQINFVEASIPAAWPGLVKGPDYRLYFSGSKLALTTELEQSALSTLLNGLLSGPPTTEHSYLINYNGDGTVNWETWTTTAGSLLAKRIDYTYSSGRVNTEVTKVYSPADGTTVVAQTTVTYTYTNGKLTSYTQTRDI